MGAKSVGFYLHPGYEILDLTGPLSAFQAANHISEKFLYSSKLYSHMGVRIANISGLNADTHPLGIDCLDTFIVAGGEFGALTPEAALAVRNQAMNARRIASVCTGAFVLAQAGLLDGKRATTHWRYVGKLQSSYPSVKVQADSIFVQDSNVWTSAGVTAGMDLALAMIQDDFGISLSRAVARQMVIYHRRPGNQSQFSTLSETMPESPRMQRVASYVRENLQDELSLEQLARVAHLSVRQFSRSFKIETGQTPAKIVERIRAEEAKLLLAKKSLSIEEISARVGFTDPERMRRAFIRIYGHAPQAVRRTVDEMSPSHDEDTFGLS